ncbi:MAG: helix-turn-helix domain-containing protein [Candidatus Binatia bacterium]|nr:helix-turn-helix domain-containing protein [Candidatus Binatia bacterium]
MKTYEAPDADRILDLRWRLGMTQEELARRLGTTVCTVDQWEHGYSRPGDAERALLDDALESSEPS